jgi:DNA-binding response OmpR family regulator
MRLLLVEDHLPSADLLVRLFTSAGFEVVHKTHGLDGLKAARSEPFDAILLDFNLPDIDGSQIGLLLRSTLKNVPLIALTAQSDKTTRKKAKVFGFNAFIPKPWSVVELLSTVCDLTTRRQEPLTLGEPIALIEQKVSTQEMAIIRVG